MVSHFTQFLQIFPCTLPDGYKPDEETSRELLNSAHSKHDLCLQGELIDASF